MSYPTYFSPLGPHVRNAALSAAVTLPRPQGALRLLIQAETQNVRFTLDGTPPTATVGFLLVAGSAPITVHAGGAGVRIIEAAASGAVNYQWGT